MGLIIQPGLQLDAKIHKVAYKDVSGTGEELQPGYVLFMDPSEGLEPDADEFGEWRLGRTFVKPATANLHMPAAVVISTPQRLSHGATTDYSSSDVSVVFPKASLFFPCYIDNLSYATGDTLKGVDGEWWLTRENVGPSSAVSTLTVGRMMNTVNLSGGDELVYNITGLL